ncbi:MAG: glycosyltransferase family 4 protein [Nitrospirota bacterium]|nr:glycosyltransferase family 4 protein [Nitrospirota bacterium]
MKIAWLHSHFYNWMGGTKFVLEVTRHLQKFAPVEIIVQNGNPRVIKKFTDAGMTVHNLHSLSTSSPFFWLGLPFFCRRDARKLRTLLDRNGFDAVISSMFPMNHISRLMNCRHIYQYCFEPFAFFWDPVMVGSHGYFTRLALFFLKSCYQRADREGTGAAEIIFTPTQETRNAILQVYDRDSVITYLGVDTDFYRPIAHPDHSTRYRGKKVLLHSTDFTPPKRTDFLLDALPELRKGVENLKLLITCSLNDATKINSLKTKIARLGLEECVEVLGFVDHELLPAYYTLADLVVYPGTSGGGGTAAVSLFVLEAMSCGTPVLRSNDSTTEVLDKVNGELFDPENRKEFEEKAIGLLNSPDTLKRYSEQTRRYIMGKYSWDKVARIIYDGLHASGAGTSAAG